MQSSGAQGDANSRRIRRPSPVPLIPPAPPSFPTGVAGFTFGETIADLRKACAAAHNGTSEARLALNGSYAECPVQLTPLDFTKAATGFHVTGGTVAVIILTPNSYADGLRRISDKYGQPSGFEVGKKWKAWDDKAAQHAPNVRWQLKGGEIYLMAEAGRVRILFFSELAQALQNEEF
jgi:hypothetical protein